MPISKEVLDIIAKLAYSEKESLKTMLFSPVVVLATLKTDKCRDLSNRPSILLVA